MSPEHISGALDIDGRADVYGFGVLFFEALTGQLPFLGDPGPALLVRILSDPAPKITLFRPDLPQQIVDIVHRAMAKDANDRFATLNDFVLAVEDYILPPSTLPRALTPMAGVPMFTMSEQRSGLADPVVQVIRRGEASGLHEINETMSLFTLPRGTVQDSVAENRDSSPGQPRTSEGRALVTTQVNFRPAFRRSARRLLAKRGVPAAIVVAALGCVVWIATSLSPHQRTDGESLRAAPLAPAPVPPVPTPEPVRAVGQAGAPSPTPAMAAHDAEDMHPVEVPPYPQQTSLTMVPQKAKSRASARASAALTEKPRPSKSAPSGTNTGTRTQATAPRAGALTPDDF
jgi:hypothetical protein